MATAIQDRACGVRGCSFFFLAPSSLLSFRSRLSAFFLFFFFHGIWCFSRLTFLRWLALRRRPGSLCLLGASGGQLQRSLLLVSLPFLSFSFFRIPSSALASSPFVEKMNRTRCGHDILNNNSQKHFPSPEIRCLSGFPSGVWGVLCFLFGQLPREIEAAFFL